MADGKPAPQKVHVHYFPGRSRPKWDAARRELEGLAAARKGDISAALQAFEDAVRLDPKPRYHFRRGELYAAIGMDEDAAQAYQEAVKLAPRRASVLAESGQRLFALGRYAESFDAFARALKESPEYFRNPEGADRPRLGLERQAYLRARFWRFLPRLFTRRR